MTLSNAGVPQSDEEVLGIVDHAFRQIPRPVAFTVADGDEECMEYDALFHAHSRESLPIEPFLSLCSPLSELSPEGVKYFFPTFARFSLSPSSTADEWFGENLLLISLYRQSFRDQCDTAQKCAVVILLRHLIDSRIDLVEEYSSLTYVEEILLLWKSEIP